MFRRFSLCVSLLIVASFSLADDPVKGKPGKFDWPGWQGSERVAYCKETGLLKEWGSDGPPISWKAKGLGGGYCTPSIASGRIFGMSSRKGDESIWALDEKDGTELWCTQINEKLPRIPNGYSEGPRGTPMVDGDNIYAVGAGGDLVCVEAATGKILWRKNYVKDFDGRMPGWAYSESPLIDGDKLICSPGGDDAAIVALDKKNGDVIWKSAIPDAGGGGAGYCSPVVAEVGGVRQYINTMSKKKGVVGVDAKTGKFLWNYARIANGTANIPTAIVRGEYVLCATGYNAGAALLKLVPTGSAGGVKVEEVWFHKGDEMQNHHGGMVVVGDYIYLGHGHNSGAPQCVEFATGKIAWTDKAAGGGSAAILFADGNLYYRYQDGTMALLEANPSAYKLISKFKLPDRSGKSSWPHPVIANGKLYILDQDTLLCFDVKQK